MDTKRYPQYAPDQALADARRTGFLVASHKKSREPLAQAWYAICARERRPFVRVMLGRLYVVVEVDMAPAAHRLSPKAQIALDAAGRQHRSPRGPFTISNQYVIIGGVAPESAEALAEQLLGIALEDMQRRG